MKIQQWWSALGALALAGGALACAPRPNPAGPVMARPPAGAPAMPDQEASSELQAAEEAPDEAPGEAADGVAEGEESAGAGAQAAAPLTQCATQEATVFGCALENGDILSVCASEPVGAAGGYVQVRVGPHGRPNVAFPPEDQGVDGLVFDRYTRPQVTHTRLSFQQGGRRYEVFDEYHHGETARGLKITRPGTGQAVVSQECTEPVTGALMMLEDVL